jgi:CRISPR-associated endonuclease/helicase Cas3
MIDDLTSEDFAEFFQEVHNCLPFPWQTRLARRLAEESKWPEVLDLPTGSGKTAALDVAIFHLALEAVRGTARRAPVRIALVVDRRLVVDDAFERAKKIANALANPPGTVTAEVARRLNLFAGEGALPLLARRLRGGIPREDDWARTPSQPTILCSTVDQVGSRLLFRGYGVSNSMKPVHAGLFGSDCLILLDEAHLSEPFRQTLGWVRRYKSEFWRENRDAVAPWGVALLTATPGTEAASHFGLEDEDKANPILDRRLSAAKPARLIELAKSRNAKDAVSDDESAEPDKVADKQRIDELVKYAKEGLESLKKSGIKYPAIAVVVNRVVRARAVFEELRKDLGEETNELILMIGPSRPVERDQLAGRLKPIHTCNPRNLEKPLLIVSTQCIEAGVDIDLDGLITEAAPLDALRQRFGRLNRAGRNIAPYAAILGSGAKADAKDPVYGEAIVNTWKYLTSNPDKPANKKQPAEVDLGLKTFEEHQDKYPINKPGDLFSPKPDAPVLLPAHLDLLSQTAPIPTADPDVSLYLHGPNRASDSVSVVWRADVDSEFPEGTYRLLLLVPPRSAEAIELPVWAVRRWLIDERSRIAELADIPGQDLDPEESWISKQHKKEQKVFRWTGKEDSSEWIQPNKIRPGDALVVPIDCGGVDEYGWNPDAPKPAKDVASEAAKVYAGHRFAVRVAPGLLNAPSDETRLSQAIASTDTRHWKTLRDAIKAIGLPEEISEDLHRLDTAKGSGRSKVECYLDVYGYTGDWPRGVVFLAPRGIESLDKEELVAFNATEDDIAGSLPGFVLALRRHCLDVEEMVEKFSERAGLPPERILDVKLAGYLHDSGKADPRFQAWLAYGDPLGADSEHILAKSARPLPRNARDHSGLPANWRHEALSVRLAPLMPRFAEAKDPELVLWLVGTHHGHGRPFFPHADPEDARERTDLPDVLGIPHNTLEAGPGPQSLAFDWRGLDWPSLYERLKARYGVWELAHMEAILRLADHRASEQAEHVTHAEEGKAQ